MVLPDRFLHKSWGEDRVVEDRVVVDKVAVVEDKMDVVGKVVHNMTWCHVYWITIKRVVGGKHIKNRMFVEHFICYVFYEINEDRLRSRLRSRVPLTQWPWPSSLAERTACRGTTGCCGRSGSPSQQRRGPCAWPHLGGWCDPSPHPSACANRRRPRRRE